jgi:acyl-coenzyme A synthetase/AMP-(fatty) acid ligase
VSPLEVENCLLQHPAVRECCVIGRKDEAGLEKPFAIVVLHQGAAPTGDGLVAFAKQNLARYKAPHSIIFRDTPLPRNDRDKIDRKKLRGDYA